MFYILEKAYRFFFSYLVSKIKHAQLAGESAYSKSLSLSGQLVYLYFYFSGKFREKASILHKIAKKKCQVEDSNGVAGKWKYRDL